jgi:hypothetical protein
MSQHIKCLRPTRSEPDLCHFANVKSKVSQCAMPALVGKLFHADTALNSQ